MVDYNFTVRAIDNLGAIADRSFSLTVVNDKPINLIITGSRGSASSYDGQFWSYNNCGPAYDIEYGNGFWIATLNNSAQDIRISSDGFNFTTVTPTFINTGFASFSITNHKIWKIKYRNSKWMGMTANHSGTVYYLESTDNCSTWTVIGSYKNGTASTGGIFDFDYYNGTWLAWHSSHGTISSTDGITWALVIPNTPIIASHSKFVYSTSPVGGYINVFNNTWFITSCRNDDNSLIYSTDGSTFNAIGIAGSFRNTYASTNPVFVNGILFQVGGTSSSNMILYKSIDFGYTWNTTTQSIGYSYGIGSRTLVNGLGTLIMAPNNNSASNIIYNSPDGLSTLNTISLGIGVPWGIGYK